MLNREPGFDVARADNAPEVVDDERLRDHHIEEMLSTFREAARMRESRLATGDEALD